MKMILLFFLVWSSIALYPTNSDIVEGSSEMEYLTNNSSETFDLIFLDGDTNYDKKIIVWSIENERNELSLGNHWINSAVPIIKINALIMIVKYQTTFLTNLL